MRLLAPLLAVALSVGLTACSEAPTKSVVTTAVSPTVARLTGRFWQQDDQLQFSWSGSAIAFRFNGTMAKIALSSNDRARFYVEVDGESRTLWVEKGEREYVLAKGLAEGEHQVRVIRETEAFTIVTAVAGPIVTDGKVLAPPAASERRLLVFGDSITAGYGVEGASKACSYSHDTSTARKAYAMLAAEKLDADVHVIAWSGIGVWRSYGEQAPTNPTMRERFNRTLADNPEAPWQPAQYMPDAIIVNLGTNDFWTGTSEGYAAAMADFLASIQTRYPSAPVYLMASPMLRGDSRNAQVQVLKSLASGNVQFFDAGGIEQADGLGCDYHPNLTTQTRLATRLASKLSQDLGW